MAESGSGPIDIEELLQRVENDLDLLAELVAIFGETRGEMSDAVHAAVAGGDAPALARSAHALKGAALNFCAADVVAAALELERMGRSGVLSGAAAAVSRLDRELARFDRALATLVADARGIVG